MEFATGAIGTLLPKLALLLRDEYNLQKGVKKGIKFLHRELEGMQKFLNNVSNVPLDQLEDQVKILARDIRELSYDIEDKIDTFMVCVDDLRPAKKRKFIGFIKELLRNHKIANDINDVKSQINEVVDRYNRYKIHDLPSNHSVIDPRISVLFEKVSNLVGTDKASDDLIRQLSEGDNTANNLKMVAVVGFGGLGKTTLAKVVFDMLKKQFDSSCFVPVGRRPNIKKALKNICTELGMNMKEELDEWQLIDRLRRFLDKRRYLIVIDDIWEKSTWQLIKHALIESNCGSRVIVTTRISPLAVEVGDIYNMERLSDEYSKDLLYTRIGNGPPDNNQSAETVKKILQKCGGVPLAIITIASLLAGKQIDDWTKVYNSIGFGSNDRNEVVENTRKILSFSYYDLPPYLKMCLLYLNIYPEDHWIWKDELIWKWVAEGFIKKEHGAELYEVGEWYFYELINKSLIQPTTKDFTQFDVVEGCRVHDMVLDLIRILAMEENFVKVLDTDHDREQYCSSSSQTCTARRIAMHKQYGSVLTLSMSQVRSFNAIGCPDIGTTPSLLTSFRILRVLSLQFCGGVSLGDLKHLGKLLQLRYLELIATEVDELPSEIGDLAHLQSLDIRHTRLDALPATVIELSNLLRLCINYDTRMLSGMGKLTSLQELRIGCVGTCPNLATELGKLSDLRKLEFSIPDQGTLKLLEESVRCLHNLQDLKILLPFGSFEDLEWDDWEPSGQLRRLVVQSVLWSLPSW